SRYDRRRTAILSEQRAACGQAPIDDHCGTSYPFGIVTGQEQRHRRDVMRMPCARNRLDRREQLLRHRLTSGQARIYQRSIDAARTDTVDTNPIFANFKGDRARQINDRRLCRAIGVRPRAAAKTRDRRGRDYRSTANLAHLGNRELHSEENRAQQNRQALVPILDRGLVDRTDRAAKAGIVVHDVEPAEFLDGARDQRLNFNFGGDVGLLKDRAAAVLLAIASRGFTAFDIQIGDHYRGTFAREPDCSCAPDSARRAGDHCDPAIESAHRGVSSHFCSSRLRTYALRLPPLGGNFKFGRQRLINARFSLLRTPRARSWPARACETACPRSSRDPRMPSARQEARHAKTPALRDRGTTAPTRSAARRV